MDENELTEWLDEAIGDYSAWNKNLGRAVRDEITKLRAELEHLLDINLGHAQAQIELRAALDRCLAERK
jgi:hypothetical protein